MRGLSFIFVGINLASIAYGAEVYDRKISINPSMVELREGSQGDATKLVDEQGIAANPLKYLYEKENKLPFSAPMGKPVTNWKVITGGAKPNYALIDLGEEYTIEAIAIYDSNGIGNFFIYPGSLNWQPIVDATPERDLKKAASIASFVTECYNCWKAAYVNTKARYLMVESETGGYAAVNEIVLYGSKAMDYSHFSSKDISDSRKLELNQMVLNSPVQPANVHPRLYGTNAKWYANVQAFDAVNPECAWEGKDAWGYVKNTKSLWDHWTLGGDKCANKLPASLDVHPDAKFYLYPSTAKWSDERGLRIMHLVRRMYACYSSGTANCLYPKEDIDRLAVAFLNYEFNRQRKEVKNSSGYYPSWHKGYSGKFFDLGAGPAFKFWCILLDTFWNHPALTATDKSYITAELENEINSYIEMYHLPVGSSSELGRWGIWGGNNWTTILNGAAMFWALTFWHEKSVKAKEVMSIILETSWLHRNFFLMDGAYVEGPSYAGATLGTMMDQNELLKGAFNQPYHALRWQTLSEKTTQWMLDNVSTDGNFLDFGDAWAKGGYGDLYYLYLKAWDEMVGIAPYGSSQINACDLKLFFGNNYFVGNFFGDPWRITPLLARDWASITSKCNSTTLTGTEVSLYPEFQLGSFRSYMPGSTQTAANAGDNLKYAQADQTFLALTAVSNTFPHREVDFGGVIWTAYGGKLLYDWGYGELNNNYQIFDIAGSKGHFVKESDNDRIEFYIRQISHPITLSKLNVGIRVHFITKEVIVSNYLTSVGTNWAKVSIPLKDFGVESSRWTSIRGEPGEPWAVPGLENIYFRNYGSVNKGAIGIDEIKIVSGVSSTKNVNWYTDTRSNSILDGARVEHSSFYLVGEELAGGAAGSAKWMKVYVGSAGNNFILNYTNDPNEFVVANLMDYLPIGANTLVLPKATDNGKRGTHRSQFKGETGTIEKLTINQRAVFRLDGSKVYGSERIDGNLEYFHRYAVPLDGGNFMMIDAFKTKPGKEDRVQEFFYTNVDNDGLDCAGHNTNVAMTRPVSHTLMLVPTCNQLKRSGPSESAGRIIAASQRGGSFQLSVPTFMKDPLFTRFVSGNTIKLKNRLNAWETRRLARYESSVDVADDVRVFLMQSATSTANLPAGSSISRLSCGTEKACFKVMNGSKQHIVELPKVNGVYQLQRVQ